MIDNNVIIRKCGTENKLLEFEMRQSIEKIRLGIGIPGFVKIPLWGPQSLLTWEFNDYYLENYFEAPNTNRDFFNTPGEAKIYLRALIEESLERWGDSLPVKFEERESGVTDFNVVLYHEEEGNAEEGYVLASAFFPNYNEKRLVIYPTLFRLSREEQVKTLVHEWGHTLGMRHYFANTREAAWPSILFGRDNPLTIMEYGSNSILTDSDKEDLIKLYFFAWSGRLTNIGGIPIQFFS